MNRAVIAIDRVATLIVALALMALGTGAIAWWLDAISWLPPATDLSAITGAQGEPWWPWVTGALGVVLVLLGLRWMLAHLPDRGVGALKLTGSNAQGMLRAVAAPVARAAAEVLAGTPGVRSTSGEILRDRGQLVARLHATIEEGADLHRVAAAADKVAAELGAVLGRDDLACQVQLKVAPRSRSMPRVT